jgi:hypothetical protein
VQSRIPRDALYTPYLGERKRKCTSAVEGLCVSDDGEGDGDGDGY